MIRFIDAVTIAATIVVAIALYAVKYDTGEEAGRIAGLKSQIAQEEQAMSILKAEWSVLNQPDRLQELAERYLTLKPIEAVQIVPVSAIPERDPAEAMDDLVRRAIGAPEATASP
jgi:hypothetical protein